VPTQTLAWCFLHAASKPWKRGVESRHLLSWRDAGSPTPSTYATSYPAGPVPSSCDCWVTHMENANIDSVFLNTYMI